jgi:chromosome segregation ATPase
MSLAAFCRSVRCRWHALARLLWPEGPGQRARAELARLNAELARRHARLVQRRRRIEQLRDALRRRERRIEQLTGGVAVRVNGSAGQAWDLALAVEDLRARLGHHEQGYERQRQRLERCKARRAALHREAAGG